MADILIDGKVKVSFVTGAIADTSAPTAAEVNAGTKLEQYITPDGLSIELGDDSVDTSALNSTFSATRVGRSTITIEITFKDQGRGVEPWTTFNNRQSGYLVVRRNVSGVDDFAISDEVEVYTVKAGDPKIMPPAENEVSKFAIDLFSSTDPVLDATVA